MEKYIIKDLYVIELLDRIKVGISKDASTRFQRIKTGSGISNSEVIYEKVFKSKGNLEGKLKRLFLKYQSNGEWFYKKGIVLKFLEEIKRGTRLDYDLIFKVQVKDDSVSHKDRALAIFKSIREERKGIGYPASPNVNTIIRSKKISYKNVVYLISDDYLTFERELKFDLNRISNSQKIECLRIIKHNTKSLLKKERLQELIDDVFTKNYKTEDEIISVIKNFFLLSYKENTQTMCKKQIPKVNLLKLNFKYDDLLKCYYIDKKTESLNKDEKMFVKESEILKLEKKYLMFIHSKQKYIIYFNEEYYKDISLLAAV